MKLLLAFNCRRSDVDQEGGQPSSYVTHTLRNTAEEKVDGGISKGKKSFLLLLLSIYPKTLGFGRRRSQLLTCLALLSREKQ